MSSTNEITKKKVKFDPLNYNEEIIEDFEIEKERDFAEEEESNDLDLDTIKASRNKSKGLKEFDSEGSEDGESEGDEANELNFEPSDSNSDDDKNSPDTFDFDEREIPIEPFNLRGDKEEGSFDSDGFYTRKYDEDADQDRWMSNLTRSDILKARQAHEERERQLKEKQKATGERRSARGLYEELLSLLSEDENDSTLQQIISKLNKKSTESAPINRAPLNKNRLKKLAKEQQSQPISRMSEGDKAKLDRITEIVDALMDLGNFGVYEETRREILNKLKS